MIVDVCVCVCLCVFVCCFKWSKPYLALVFPLSSEYIPCTCHVLSGLTFLCRPTCLDISVLIHGFTWFHDEMKHEFGPGSVVVLEVILVVVVVRRRRRRRRWRSRRRLHRSRGNRSTRRSTRRSSSSSSSSSSSNSKAPSGKKNSGWRISNNRCYRQKLIAKFAWRLSERCLNGSCLTGEQTSTCHVYGLFPMTISNVWLLATPPNR